MTLLELLEKSANDALQVTVKNESDTVVAKFTEQYHTALSETLLAYPVTNFTIDRTNGLIISINESATPSQNDPGTD